MFNFLFKIPEDCTLSLDSFEFEGMMRPKNFIRITLSSEELGMSFCKYALSGPFLLRWRLFKKVQKLKASVRKAKKFKRNWGL